MGRTTIKPQRKELFLKAFAKTGIIGQAEKLCGISRDAHLRWTHEDPEYAAAFERAKQEAIESLEAEMIRRGREGWDESVFYKGDEVGTVRKYSDTLLIFALKGWAPEKYRERIDVNGQQTHLHLHAHRIGLGSDAEAASLGGDVIARVLGSLASETGGEGMAGQRTNGHPSQPKPA